MRKSKNYIIIGLCMVLLLMAVGYASFSALLSIGGTASFSNNWKIEITGIRGVNNSAVSNNQAYDNAIPTYSATTATFSTGLVKPGDEKIYEVEKCRIIKNTESEFLEETEDNMLTLITYVENQPEYRRCIQAEENEV